jgi:tetratricopeptide (TPR) repeat protein
MSLLYKDITMSLNDVVQNFLNDPNNDEEAKNNIRSLMTSHLATGMKLQGQGLLREAIEEFAKENNRPIHSAIDKEIAQKSYVHIGDVYRKLGEVENAKAAFQKARELLKLYRVGSAPHYDLAEIMIEEGQLDEAIAICQEALEDVPDGGIKQLLAKALEMKNNRSE